MTDTPKDKQAAALERIKQLSAQRSAGGSSGPDPKNAPGTSHPKQAPKHGTVGHRPQGG